MHAVIIDVTFNDEAAARAELDQLVPQVAAAPGFVAGYWIAPSSEKGTSIVVCDSEESAQALAGMAEGAPAMVVTMDSITVGEVLAHAQALDSVSGGGCRTGVRHGPVTAGVLECSAGREPCC